MLSNVKVAIVLSCFLHPTKSFFTPTDLKHAVIRETIPGIAELTTHYPNGGISNFPPTQQTYFPPTNCGEPRVMKLKLMVYHILT